MNIMKQKNTREIIIFDTTLRDGEQSPGATMSMREKIEVAHALDQMGVDVIEAGFAAASEGDFQCIEKIGGVVKNAIVCSLARAKHTDIDAANSALKSAEKRRIHTFISTSETHLKYQFKLTQEEVLTIIDESVRYARNFCDDIEWTAMDATRSHIDFLARAVEIAINAGAKTINVPDTVGYTIPEEYAQMIRLLKEKVPNIDKAIISVHCHNDLGLAVANSLAAINAGATQVECTINGIGERAGNAALEEIVMAIKTRNDKFAYHTHINSTHIACVSQLVSKATGFVVQKNKAIVGENAFSHESGIHQDGMLKSRETYEIMTPESIGFQKSKLVMGKHSGRAAFRDKLMSLGIHIDEASFQKSFEAFKKLGDAQKQIENEDIIALVKNKSSTMKMKTLYDKIWDQHKVFEKPDGTSVIYIDKHLIHEVTSPQAFEGIALSGRKIRRPKSILAVCDHNVPTINRSAGILDQESRTQVNMLAENCRKHKIHYIDLFDKKQGIVHVIGPEQGFTLPGTTIVCGDSHTSTHGAFGALAFGIGTSEVEHVFATQTLVLKKSKTLRISIEGILPFGITAKDIILSIISKIGTSGATGYVIEYTGSVIKSLSMEARMTICNMSIEAGARAGLIAPDKISLDYLQSRPHSPQGELWKKAVKYWETLYSDPDAQYDQEVIIKSDQLAPHVTWGTSPETALPIHGCVPDPAQEKDPVKQASILRALEYMGLSPGTPLENILIDKVFIGSCTNARIEDLRDAAAVLKGRKIAKHIDAMVVPGSGLVKAQAESEGLNKIFIKSGFDWREPGCSMCLAMNADKLNPGERCASTSNRNFEGRQGRGGRNHLMSPAMAAAAAITGKLTDVRKVMR